MPCNGGRCRHEAKAHIEHMTPWQVLGHPAVLLLTAGLFFCYSRNAWASSSNEYSSVIIPNDSFSLGSKGNVERRSGLGAHIFFFHAGMQFDENQPAAWLYFEDAQVGDDEVNDSEARDG